MPVARRQLWIAGLILLASCLAFLLASRPARPALLTVSSDPNIKVQAVLCTFGTNHTYYYGDKVDRLIDSFIPGRREKNAAWLRWHTAENSTVAWVCLVHPSYGVPRFRGSPVAPPPLFRAKMVDPDGAVTILKTLDTFQQDFRSKSLLTGWELAGRLTAH